MAEKSDENILLDVGDFFVDCELEHVKKKVGPFGWTLDKALQIIMK